MDKTDPNQLPKETPPAYRRQAQWFAVAVVIILSVVLLIDSFKRSGRKKRAPEKQAFEEPDRIRKSELDFQKRFEQELGRRKLRSETYTEEPRPFEVLERHRAELNNPAVNQNVETLSLEEQWEQKERQRALDARKSGFRMKNQSETAQRKMMIPVSAHMSRTDKQSFILSEQERVEKQIAAINEMQTSKTLNRSMSLGGFSRQDKSVPDMLVKGNLVSAEEPRPGQKLIPTGTVISAVLDQELMSDYTGAYRCLVSCDVYDVSGRYILIPKGSKAVGQCLRINNVNEPIQARMGLTVKWVVLPDGKRISFEKRGGMLDQAGIPAIKDQVNYHLIAQFLGVAAYALLSSETSRQGSGMNNDSTFKGDVGQSLREQFSPMAAKYLTLVPTITLRSGTPVKIFIEDDIYASSWGKVSDRLLRADTTSY